jgi:hypothetical protein
MKVLGWVLTILGWYLVVSTIYSVIAISGRVLDGADRGEWALFWGSFALVALVGVGLTRWGKKLRIRAAQPVSPN